MIFLYNIDQQNSEKLHNLTGLFPKEFLNLINAFKFNETVKKNVLHWVQSSQPLNQLIQNYYSKTNDDFSYFLICQNDRTNQLIIMISNDNESTYKIGDEGSILSILRSYNLNDDFICSDCYGQMACSSCAVNVLYGNPKNPVPREEESDMFDLVKDNEMGFHMRLSCQTILKKSSPLALKILK